MKTLTGLYRAICLGTNADTGTIRCQVPQIFNDETVTCFDRVGGLPNEGDIGWVAFESGYPDHPVWLSGVGAAGGGDEVFVGPDDPGSSYELWYDTDAVPSGGGGGGSGGPISYVHNQSVPAATWTITHSLGWYPNVTVEDSAGTVVEGDVTYTSSNQISLHFSGAFSGVAYLS